MHISYNWLKRYLPGIEKIDIKELADKISSSLAEVEEIKNRGEGLEKIVVGKILDVSPHPKSEKLMLAKVDTNDKTRQIAFAASDKQYVTINTLYPVCLPGGKVYDKKVYSNDSEKAPGLLNIEIREIDGEVSEGMLCSPKELGISDENKGVSLLESTMNPGEDLTPFLKDYIFEIENKSLTHRPDCFSHRGIAREISAIMRIDFLESQMPELPAKTSDLNPTVKVRDNKNCRRFTGVAMHGIKVGQSPFWMQILLNYTGTRPINNIVDISNFVMLDTGYPTHIYDLDTLPNSELTVRKATTKEAFTGLNEKSYVLDTDMVVVASKNGVEDLAGIMGGASSEITDKTKNIFIESASFNMFNIRKTSMKLGLTSEASNRYSKGLDSVGTFETVIRTAILVEDICDGEIGSDIIDIQNEDPKKEIIAFDLRSIPRLVGIQIPKEEIITILESLKITIINKSDTPLNMTVNQDIVLELEIPSYRMDLNIEQDIVEEIARIYGYDNVIPKLPRTDIAPVKINPNSKYTRLIRKGLLDSGLDEIYTYAFSNEDMYEKSNLDPKMSVKLKNPASSELTLMRHEILPSHLKKVELNLKNFNNFGYFEISKIALKDKDKNGLPLQPRKVSGLLVETEKGDNVFYNLKKKLNLLFEALSITPEYSNIDNSSPSESSKIMHPSKSAIIQSGKDILGYIGKINPVVNEAFGYKSVEIALFDLDFEKLKELSTQSEFEYAQITNHQILHRDINVFMNPKSEIGEIIKKISSQNFKFITNVSLVDTYTDKNNKTSATFRFNIETKSEEKITDTDIKDLIEKIESFIQENLELELKR